MSLEDFYYGYRQERQKATAAKGVAAKRSESSRSPDASTPDRDKEDNYHSTALSAERNSLLAAFYTNLGAPNPTSGKVAIKGSAVPGKPLAATNHNTAAGNRATGTSALTSAGNPNQAAKRSPSADQRWVDFFNYQKSPPADHPETAAHERNLGGDEAGDAYRKDFEELSARQERERRWNEEQARADNPGAELYYREMQKKKNLEQERKRAQQEQAAVEAQELTFKPQINKYFRSHSSRGGSDGAPQDQEESFSRGSAAAAHRPSHGRPTSQSHLPEQDDGEGEDGGVYYARDGDVSNRLYRIHYDVLAKRKDAAERARLEEERKNKFQPKLVHSARYHGVGPKYLGPQQRTPSATVAEMLQREEQELTHTPVTNKRVPPYVSMYLRTPAHRRLSAPRGFVMPTTASPGTTIGAAAARGRQQHHTPRAANRYTGGAISSEDEAGFETALTFPQYDAALGDVSVDEMHHHHGVDVSGFYSPSFYDVSMTERSGGGRAGKSNRTPNRHDKNNARRTQSEGPRLSKEDQKRFEERQARWREKAMEKKREMEEEERARTPFKPNISQQSIRIMKDPEAKRRPLTEPLASHRHADPELDREATFAPAINPESQVLSKKWREKTAPIVQSRRQVEAELYRESKEMSEREAVTLRPDISISTKTVEKPGFIKNAIRSAENFKDFLSMQRARREQDLAPHRREIKDKEKATYTFKPEIHDAPPYVKDIAEQMALVRGERSVVAANYHADPYQGAHHPTRSRSKSEREGGGSNSPSRHEWIFSTEKPRAVPKHTVSLESGQDRQAGAGAGGTKMSVSRIITPRRT